MRTILELEQSTTVWSLQPMQQTEEWPPSLSLNGTGWVTIETFPNLTLDQTEVRLHISTPNPLSQGSLFYRTQDPTPRATVQSEVSHTNKFRGESEHRIVSTRDVQRLGLSLTRYFQSVNQNQGFD